MSFVSVTFTVFKIEKKKSQTIFGASAEANDLISMSQHRVGRGRYAIQLPSHNGSLDMAELD